MIEQPIVVPEVGDSEIEISARVLSDENHDSSLIKVQVGISTADSNFSDDHFSALFVLGEISGSKMIKPASELSAPLAINPQSDLYSWLLFQGPKFQLIDSLYKIDAAEAVFATKKLENDSSDICFPKERQRPFTLGSPLLRDVMLQSAQLMLTKQILLPVAIKRWDFMNIGDQTKGGIVECKFLNWDKDTGICDVAYYNSSGEIVESIQGYRIKTMEPTAHYPNPEDIAALPSEIGARFSEEFAKHKNLIESNFEVIITKHIADFHTLKSNERRSLQSEVLRNHIKKDSQLKLNTDQNKIEWASNGKPSLGNSELNISITHSQSILLMTLGQSIQGCDIEKIAHRDIEEWKNLLDNRYMDTIHAMHSSGTDHEMDQNCTRIWGAREACMKALGFIPMNITVKKNDGSAVIFEVTHQKNVHHILTFPFELLPDNIYMVTMLVQLKHNEIENSKVDMLNIDNIFDPESKKFITRFYTTFKDCRGFYGKTYFIDFPLWMGTLREYILTPVKKKLLKDLVSGEFGMVTNESTITIYNEADTLDKITGKIWIDEKTDLKNSLIVLGYEWFKHTEDGKTEKLADCMLSTTWVKIEKRGIVKICPIPQYFYEFLEKHQNKNGGNGETHNLTSQFPQHQHLGKLLYESNASPRPEILLNKKLYQTGISNSNTVGNLYFSNYYDWQAKNIESFLFEIVPEVFLQNGKAGEFITLKSNTIHLQEAMPFEDIEVCMYLENLYDCGMKLHFEFFSIGNNYKRKLAYGSNTLLWAKRNSEFSLPNAQVIPESIIQTCLKEKNSMVELR